MAALESSPANRVIETLTRLTPIQKIALGAAALTIIGGTLVLTSASGNTAMAAVYTDLEPRDASSVTDELISRNVDYELADGGRTVLVPRDDVYDLRIALSGEGLPTSNEGYALLDRQGITTSEFRQRIDFQRALEGELSRTLRSIDGIDTATVHLALPEDSVFVDEPTKATASVLVRSSNPSSVSGEQVSAMVHLVASSVKGMAPEDVTIADASGTVLTDAAIGGAGGAGRDARTQATSAVEQEVATKVRAMVAQVTGLEHVAVSVQADLELTQRQETSETFNTSDVDGTGVVIAERTANESYTGTEAPGETGVLGPDGAVVEAVESTTDGGDRTYQKDDAERTYAVNRTVEQVTTTPGTVQRLHVAVLVDEASVAEDQVEAITAMVSTAAGLDVERGDQVVVTRLAFNTAGEEEAALAADGEAAAIAAEAQSSMIRTGIIAFLVLIALLLAYRSARRARRVVATPIDIGAIRSAPLDPDTAVALEPGVPSEPQPIAVGSASSSAALEELSTLADRRPEEVAQILQSWLADEQAPV